VRSLNASVRELNHLLGNIDIYLLDQLLKGRFRKSHKIIDVGCGEGRNMIYFLRNNYQVWGVDKNEDAIKMLRYVVSSLNSEYPLERFAVGLGEQLDFEDQCFDVCISSAVLHFAENQKHFDQLLAELVRVLKPGGILFLRMATIFGMEQQARWIGDDKYLLPDGSVRFLLTPDLLKTFESQFQFLEPFKTVLVDGSRSMGVFVLKVPSSDL
jgi:SAM-dependent methyltransferase